MLLAGLAEHRHREGRIQGNPDSHTRTAADCCRKKAIRSRNKAALESRQSRWTIGEEQSDGKRR